MPARADVAAQLNRTGGTSICEDRPADVVAPGLISEHEVSHLARKLLTLPLALDPAGASVARTSNHGSLDRIGGCAEVVLGNMCNTGCLTRGIGSETRGSSTGSRRRHGVPAQSPRLHHLHPTVGPRSGRRDRLARARVCGLFCLEELQHVLSAGRGPEGQHLVMGVGERPTAADRDQALVTDAGQDHASSMPVSRPATRAFFADRRSIPGLRMTVVTGPRIDPSELPSVEGVECRSPLWRRQSPHKNVQKLLAEEPLSVLSWAPPQFCTSVCR